MTVDCSTVLGDELHLLGEFTLYHLVLTVPPILFLLFLLYQLPTTYRILRELMPSIRVFRGYSLSLLWIVCVTNLAHVTVQITSPGSLVWKISWVATRAALFFIQLSILIFLIELVIRNRIALAHRFYKMDPEIQTILRQTVVIAFVLMLIDTVTESLLIFVFDIILFETSQNKAVCAYWIGRASILLIAYATVLAILYFRTTPIQERNSVLRFVSSPFSTMQSNSLPLTEEKVVKGRKEVIGYVAFASVLTCAELIGWSFLSGGLDIGTCFIGVELILFYTVYPPLVYLTFMAGFFVREEHWPLLSPRTQIDEENERRERREKRKRARQRQLEERVEWDIQRQSVEIGTSVEASSSGSGSDHRMNYSVLLGSPRSSSSSVWISGPLPTVSEPNKAVSF